jgi:MFS family permease
MSDVSFAQDIKRNQLVLALYLPALILAFSQSLLDPVLPLFAKGLNINYGLVGLVVAGYTLGMLLGDIPSGMLLRSFGKKRSMMLGFAVSSLATLSLYFMNHVPGVIFCRMLSGFGIALFNIARHAYLADSVSIANRGRVIALLGGVFRLGNFLGPAVGGIIAASYGLRLPFLLYGSLLLSGLLIIALFVHRTESVHEAGRIFSQPLKFGRLSTLKASLRPLTFAGSAQLFAQLIRQGRGTIIPLYGADILGLDVDTIGYIISIAAAIDMSLFLPTGWIMDRLGRKVAIVPAFAIMAVGMAVLPLAGSSTGLMLAAALMGFGNGLSSGAMLTLGADLAPKDARGEFLGLWRFIGDTGATGGPLVVGGVAEALTLPTAALVVAVAGILASSIFVLRVPETLRKQAYPLRSG